MSRFPQSSCSKFGAAIFLAREEQKFARLSPPFVFQLGITNFSGVLSTTHVGYLASKLIGKAMNKGGKVLKKLWCCVGGRV